ncbi:MAG: cobalt-precorrin-5B (C(1))-methyltransferase CbiD [Candidatus Omnitrophota bacterium]|nr:cobalt-precorrin-5B (C(1))-methyltransferase CbiD [Candidatus Omnitrophota bacterium]
MNLKEKLKTGFTTGTCAQAAAKAASLMLVTKKIIKSIDIETASGVKLNLKIIDQEIGRDFTQCAVVKDAGDDPDVTDGAKIYARVKYSDKKGISIRGGEGVGVVTKPGLAVSVGEYAINPTPRQMIIKEVTPYLARLYAQRRGLPKDKGVEVIISVPQGKEIAKHTFNPRLGIVGGISIIGTTGIVEPKSTDAYKMSLSLELDVLKAAGYKKATLVLGYVGEKFCKEVLGLKPDSIVKIGDHVGFMLSECVKKKIRKVMLIGHIGKLVKLVNGQFNTHCQFGDERIETIAHYAKLSQATRPVLEEILKQTSAEATIAILKNNSLTQAFHRLAQKIVSAINEFTDNQLQINCILLSLKGEILSAYPREAIRI